MPDGDKVHEGLAWKYQKAYKQICDGQFGGRELANEVVAAVWKDVQKVGDKLIPLFQQVAEQCKHIQDRCLFEEIDWQKESGNIEAHGSLILKASLSEWRASVAYKSAGKPSKARIRSCKVESGVT